MKDRDTYDSGKLKTSDPNDLQTTDEAVPLSNNVIATECNKTSEINLNETPTCSDDADYGNQYFDDTNEQVQPLQSESQADWADIENETRCGIGPFHPGWLQKLASKKTYVLVYGLIGMMDIAIGSYFVSTISTIEKRFQIPSRISGMIISAWDAGGLCSTLLLAYLGGKGHKTRWVAGGIFLVGLSCFMRLIPHFLYGPGENALALTTEYGDSYDWGTKNSSLSSEHPAFVCNSDYQEQEEDCSTGGSSTTPSAIFLVSFFVIGVGTSMYYTLGVAYMDDNVHKNKTPFFLAIWQCIRMLGPTIGFLYGSYALKLYVEPSVHPTITSDDPRWIGAWWHAWAPFGVTNIILAGILALFPRKLPRAAQRSIKSAAAGDAKESNTTRSFTDFKMVLKRLFKNKILIFNSFSSVFFMFGMIGYWTFMPKYMETQFRQSASKSSLITGTIGLIFSAMGIMAAGIVITKLKPRAQYLAAWNVIVESLDVIGHFLYGFLNCSIDDLHGEMLPDHSWNLTADCNSNCDCGSSLKYSPVCALDGFTSFYSPCHAGCTTLEVVNGTKTYGNCSCIGSDGMGWAVDGSCPVDCSTNFTIFLVIQCTMRFFMASGRAGNTIIQFRCVDPDDKSVAIGLTEALLCGFAFIPGPIVYGMLLDSACIVWGQTCGQQGNCWLYDGHRLGFLLNFTASAFLLGGTLLDVGVWYHVGDLQIYDEENEMLPTGENIASKEYKTEKVEIVDAE